MENGSFLFRALGALAVTACPIVVFWWVGDRLDGVCREGEADRCGMWTVPQHWDPETVRVVGLVAAGVLVVCFGLLVWGWHRRSVRYGMVKVFGRLLGAGAALGFAARVLSARSDDDGNLSFVVLVPVLAVAVGLIVAAGVEAVRIRTAARS
jgi:hypothetical protein